MLVTVPLRAVASSLVRLISWIRVIGSRVVVVPDDPTVACPAMVLHIPTTLSDGKL